ncbi:SDR family NAD(P)-dependent oxidoreductase [Sphingomonas radiodurans]|uniref:SDR family NAD(P)-dependent oxidoreductase n=1 Tax=Sphingomonas radiodurans TaxID=2890321 RepID=UPI001E43E486|nr:SDR family NAD(P)-dependent oxidoreductase [Sphingomonas radiodurans]WBH17754.1 SDR family NAD(P)-dependent oxidoreductase [Sphingomonas radiodurans]
MNTRRIIVTGAGSGIGAATATRLRADGASVFGVDQKGAVDLTIDVTEPGASEAIITDATDALGGIEGVAACAGISGAQPLDGHDDAFWDRVMAVNVTAVFRLIRAATPALASSGRGRIVTIGSVMSSFGASGLVAYAASKHAVLGMTRALAAELGLHGITVNCVQPGAIDTPMTAPAFTADPAYGEFWRQKAPLGRLGTPEDVADVIAFLLSDDARFVSGHGIFVDGAAMARP